MAVYLPLAQTEKILQQMERSHCKRWYVYDTDKTLISENASDTGTIEDSYNDLKQLLESLDGDTCFVVIRNKDANKDEEGNYKRGLNTKGVAKYEYRVRLKDSGQSSRGMQGMAGIGDIFGLYEKIGGLQAQLVEAQYKPRIEALEKLVKEGNSGSSLEKIAGLVVDKFIEAYDKEIKPANGAVKEKITEETAKPEPGTPLTPEQQKQKSIEMAASIKDVASVLGRDTNDFLKDLAERAKENPEFFKMFAKASVEKKLNLKDLVK